MTNQETSVAIIGYGTAGVNALIALRNAGYTGKIQVFSNTSIPPYSPILTSDYAGGQKSWEQCFPWSAEELAELGAEVLTGSAVVELDPANHRIRTAMGDYSYTKCVIASGATPMRWGFPACDYEPLVLRTMEDAERLKAALLRPGCRRVLVSGASLVALKSLEAALERGAEVTLVGMNPHVLDFNALPEAAIRFEQGLLRQGVRLLLGQTIQTVQVLDSGSGSGSEDCPDSASGSDPSPESAAAGRQLQVTFSGGETAVFDEITVAHGMKCNLDFLAEGALEMDRALLVDEWMRTSDPDVYAAGDVAQALELVSGEQRIVGIWKNAAVQGACAGRAIAAELACQPLAAEDAYPGSIATNTIAVRGTLFISAGTMELTPDRYTEIEESDDMTVIRIYQRAEADAQADAVTDAGAGTEADAVAGTDTKPLSAETNRRLVGFNLVCDEDVAGSKAYDLGAMLTLRIEQSVKQ